MIITERVKLDRVCQGDIFRDIEYIEYYKESDGNFEIAKIEFPLVLVLTQDCDLTQDFNSKMELKKKKPDDTKEYNQDKHLISVIVAPLYNAEHVFVGEHLSDIDMKMQNLREGSRTKIQFLKNNEVPRYHYMEFDENVQLPATIIDFKHYFSVNVEYLLEVKSANFVCKIAELYRESISQRFANYLARIGLP